VRCVLCGSLVNVFYGKYLWTRLNNRLLYSMSDYFYVLVTVVRKNIRYVNIGKYTKLKY